MIYMENYSLLFRKLKTIGADVDVESQKRTGFRFETTIPQKHKTSILATFKRLNLKPTTEQAGAYSILTIPHTKNTSDFIAAARKQFGKTTKLKIPPKKESDDHALW